MVYRKGKDIYLNLAEKGRWDALRDCHISVDENPLPFHGHSRAKEEDMVHLWRNILNSFIINLPQGLKVIHMNT